MDQPGKVANPARGQLKRGKQIPCPRACLRIWSREMGSAVPSRVSLLISILRLILVLTWRRLRRSWDPPRRTVRFPTPTLDNRYDVRRAQTSGTGTDKQHSPRDLLHRSGKSIRLGRSCAIMGDTCPFWSPASDDQGHPHVSRWYEGSRTVG